LLNIKIKTLGKSKNKKPTLEKNAVTVFKRSDLGVALIWLSGALYGR
jgi:hypothetical protein